MQSVARLHIFYNIHANDCMKRRFSGGQRQTACRREPVWQRRSRTLQRWFQEKIREAIKKLNYHPNSTARNLASGASCTIGLVIDAADEGTFANSFFNRSVYAIEKTLQEHAYSLLITNNRPVSSIRSLVYEKRVDGLIIPPASLDEETVKFLEEEHFPFVVLGEPEIGQTRTTWVDVDNRKGSREAVTHLCRQGFRRIVMIVRNDRTVFARNRIYGYQDGVTEICPPQVIYVEEPNGQQRPPEQADVEFWTDGQAAKLEELAVRLVGEGKADAFLCADNEIAYHVLRALRGAGIRIPEEAGVVTFDNYPLAPFMDPPLTAVDVDTSRLGKAAAELLIQSIHEADRPPRQVLIGASLIRRMSSAGKEGQ